MRVLTGISILCVLCAGYTYGQEELMELLDFDDLGLDLRNEAFIKDEDIFKEDAYVVPANGKTDEAIKRLCDEYDLLLDNESIDCSKIRLVQKTTAHNVRRRDVDEQPLEGSGDGDVPPPPPEGEVPPPPPEGEVPPPPEGDVPPPPPKEGEESPPAPPQEEDVQKEGEIPEPLPEAKEEESPADEIDVQAAGGLEEPKEETAPETVPEAAPEEALEGLPEEAPESVPEAAPEEVPEALPEEVPESVPEAAPEEVSEAAPEAAPEEAPESVPETAPEAALEEVPAAIPEAVPEAVTEPPEPPTTVGIVPAGEEQRPEGEEPKVDEADSGIAATGEAVKRGRKLEPGATETGEQDTAKETEQLHEQQSGNAVAEVRGGTIEEVDKAVNAMAPNAKIKSDAEEPKSGESAKETESRKDTKVLVTLFVVVVVIGAAAFTYNFIKKRKQKRAQAVREENGDNGVIKRSQAKADPEQGTEMKPLMKNSEPKPVVADYMDEKVAQESK
ncbi:hypothetical protein NQ318_004191 [Aromia moschata]|uniref:Uncharacterized protein n=1 Tax=Aromia moschata TaxID=1265417 RepID=A0AAV8Y4F8_9CUCU|nr:hypothetical protein NQ318_004191 [Aromia moschata]